jgi:hypothetical protein
MRGEVEAIEPAALGEGTPADRLTAAAERAVRRWVHRSDAPERP